MAYRMILAGDVGGTKTLLAAYDRAGRQLTMRVSERLASADYPTFDALVKAFLHKHQISADAGCFGIPGPVVEGRVRATNLPWTLSEESLENSLGISKVKLLNDLAATSTAIPHLPKEDLEILYLPDGYSLDEDEPMAVVAPGTGLGVGCVRVNGSSVSVLPSEGGHASFAPQNDIEDQLLEHLRRKFGRVSYERVLCGPGLVNVYHFFLEEMKIKENPYVTERFKDDDPAAVVTNAAQRGESEAAALALDLFIRILGSYAGDMVLTFVSTGGVYFAGGIVPRIIDQVKGSALLESYFNRGRLTPLVKNTPVYVVMDPRAGLHGAAYAALEAIKS